MKLFLCILTCWLLVSPSTISFGQSHDTLATAASPVSTTLASPESTTYATQPDNDFAPGLLGVAVAGVTLILGIIGAGIALTFLGVLLVAGLVSFGLLSASVLFGLHRRSFAKGFRIFVVSVCTVGGSAVGGVGLFFVSSFMHWWTPKTSLISGSVGGLLAGFLLGLFVCYFLQRLTRYVQTRLDLL
jgi:predicted lipid-binding transport protein (Tim44 family)